MSEVKTAEVKTSVDCQKILHTLLVKTDILTFHAYTDDLSNFTMKS